MFTSIAQLVLSCVTLYRTRGHQLDRYGYAAFGLSVFPYALMSFVNLVTLGIIGEYPCLFVLRTAISEEANGCGGRISGELGMDVGGHGVDATLLEVRGDGENNLSLGVGDVDRTGTPAAARVDKRKDCIANSMKKRLSLGQEEFTAAWLRTEETEHGKILVVKTSNTTKRFKLVDRNVDFGDALTFYVDSITNQPKSKHKPYSNREHPWIIVLVVLLPYLFIYLLTRFHKQRSTVAQRGWMMSWLVLNQVASGWASNVGPTHLALFGGAAPGLVAMLVFFAIAPYIVVAVGGFVMVGKMLIEFGSCSLSL